MQKIKEILKAKIVPYMGELSWKTHSDLIIKNCPELVDPELYNWENNSWLIIEYAKHLFDKQKYDWKNESAYLIQTKNYDLIDPELLNWEEIKFKDSISINILENCPENLHVEKANLNIIIEKYTNYKDLSLKEIKAIAEAGVLTLPKVIPREFPESEEETQINKVIETLENSKESIPISNTNTKAPLPSQEKTQEKTQEEAQQEAQEKAIRLDLIRNLPLTYLDIEDMTNEDIENITQFISDNVFCELVTEEDEEIQITDVEFNKEYSFYYGPTQEDGNSLSDFVKFNMEKILEIMGCTKISYETYTHPEFDISTFSSENMHTITFKKGANVQKILKKFQNIPLFTIKPAMTAEEALETELRNNLPLSYLNTEDMTSEDMQNMQDSISSNVFFKLVTEDDKVVPVTEVEFNKEYSIYYGPAQGDSNYLSDQVEFDMEKILAVMGCTQHDYSTFTHPEFDISTFSSENVHQITFKEGADVQKILNQFMNLPLFGEEEDIVIKHANPPKEKSVAPKDPTKDQPAPTNPDTVDAVILKEIVPFLKLDFENKSKFEIEDEIHHISSSVLLRLENEDGTTLKELEENKEYKMKFGPLDHSKKHISTKIEYNIEKILKKLRITQNSENVWENDSFILTTGVGFNTYTIKIKNKDNALNALNELAGFYKEKLDINYGQTHGGIENLQSEIYSFDPLLASKITNTNTFIRYRFLKYLVPRFKFENLNKFNEHYSPKYKEIIQKISGNINLQFKNKNNEIINNSELKTNTKYSLTINALDKDDNILNEFDFAFYDALKDNNINPKESKKVHTNAVLKIYGIESYRAYFAKNFIIEQDTNSNIFNIVFLEEDKIKETLKSIKTFLGDCRTLLNHPE